MCSPKENLFMSEDWFMKGDYFIRKRQDFSHRGADEKSPLDEALRRGSGMRFRLR
jgi:hypothetical protein